MSKEILINQLFAGKYLNEGENIGHEVINLFRDDDGNSNLFITPNGKVGDHDIDCVIFVRNVSARKTVEVIGMAKGLYPISMEEKHNIRYAGVSLKDIFSKNQYRGERDAFSEYIVTCRAERFLLPTKTVYLTIDDEFDCDEYVVRLKSERKVIIPQSCREYYSNEIDSEAYTKLKALINNKKIWSNNKTTERIIPDGDVHNQSLSFLEVIRKEDDENIFSNLLAYYFEYSHKAFQRFANTVLGITDMSASFSISRETKNRIDLYIKSDENIIVIENKIRSGINGITKDDGSQLSKYYKVAKKEAKKNNKVPYFYIFLPNYSKIDLSQYENGEEFKPVTYSKIFNFFVKETETYMADRFFTDFIRGLKRHTLSYPELQFENMRTRLLRKINNSQ